jgi:hypothetical protein
MQFRKKKAFELQQKNMQMVNSLLQVKPNVPMAVELKKWSTK